MVAPTAWALTKLPPTTHPTLAWQQILRSNPRVLLNIEESDQPPDPAYGEVHLGAYTPTAALLGGACGSAGSTPRPRPRIAVVGGTGVELHAER